MIRSKIQKYEMLTRVTDYATKNSSLFPKKTAGAELVKNLQTVAGKLSETKASQSAAKDRVRTSRNQRLAKLEDLRSQLDAIHQTAAALKIEGFSLPEGAGVSTLFDAASNYAEAVEPLKTEFVRHGLPSDFIENLNSAAEDLRAAIAEQVDARGRRKAAIQEFDQALEEGLDYLSRFEALLTNTMSENPSVMASWEVARRVERTRSFKKAVAAPAATPTPAPQPQVASTA
jgi:uncharacterized phage infection (PIP) family protein YhgE